MSSGRKAANLPQDNTGYSLPGTGRDFQPAPSLEPVDLKPITRKLAPKIKDMAIYKGVNLMDELNAGNRLEDRGLLQLDHAFDLAKYSTKNQFKRDVVDRQRDELRDALAQNDLSRHLSETGQNPAAGVFKYRGETFDLSQGHALMKREHENFLKTERWLTPPEIKQAKSSLPEPSPKSTLKGVVEKQA